ncbi:MAG: ATP-binding protein, partial [bacterium]
MTKELPRHALIERSLIKKYRETLWNPFTYAVGRYELIQPGDRIAACISGGKDSMLMAKLLEEIQKHGNVPFSLTFLVMNPGYNAENLAQIEENAAILNLPIHIFETDIFAAAAGTERNPCYLCARMRRGALYAEAQRLGCNKIALGHHFNDVIETTVL